MGAAKVYETAYSEGAVLSRDPRDFDAKWTRVEDAIARFGGAARVGRVVRGAVPGGRLSVYTASWPGDAETFGHGAGASAKKDDTLRTLNEEESRARELTAVKMIELTLWEEEGERQR